VGTSKKGSINRLKNARRRRNRWLLVILIVASVLALGWQFVEGEEAEFRKVRAAEAPVMHPETQPLLPTVGDGEDPNGEDAQEATAPSPPAKSCDSLRVLVDPAHPLPPDYAPEGLVSLWAYGIPTLGEDMLLRREAAEHLSHLVAAAAADGEELVVASAYRSYLQQQGSYGRLTSVYGADAGRMSARTQPAPTRHRRGLQ
jgi:D-alanyl-D-alanine carboxypeptidase